MAGGNFDINVGKTRPGTYVNVKSKRQQKAKGSRSEERRVGKECG